jgi:REase_MTES_1575/AAA domain/Protein of unknown function (DUF4011)
MPATEQRILKKMLERLFASLTNGPSLNCRPHSSRQRIDLTQLAKLKDVSPEDILRQLLGETRSCKVNASVKPLKGKANSSESDEVANEAEPDEKPEEKKARQAFTEQNAVLNKLRTMAEDSRTYENDTGVHVLQLGFPLLSIPLVKTGQGGMSRRVLAPLAFISLSLSVRKGARSFVEMECRNEGVDLVVPNIALLAWLEQQTRVVSAELDADEKGDRPWHEIVSIVRAVCKQLTIEMPLLFENPDDLPILLEIQPAPRSDDEGAEIGIIPAGVIGLYPTTNQGLLRDTQALIAEDVPGGPIQSFLKINQDLTTSDKEKADPPPAAKSSRRLEDERLVAVADPCQSRAVMLARTSPALVVHGPPGTGKSQTITNIIGDHLARGERVLFVCDKRTALDVVMNRLESLGLGSLCAVVHDPQRDQKDLYRSIREQLDGLTETRTESTAEKRLNRLNAELQQLHAELSDYHRALMSPPDGDSESFHDLMGEWLRLPAHDIDCDADAIVSIPHAEFEDRRQAVVELLDRAAQAEFACNPWAAAAGMPLEDFLGVPLDEHRTRLNKLREASAALDRAPGSVTAFAHGLDYGLVARARVKLADELKRLVQAVPLERRQPWAEADMQKVLRARQTLLEIQPVIRQIQERRLDAELELLAHTSAIGLPAIAEQMVVLQNYCSASQKWYGFLAFGKKKAAALVLIKYGLTLSADNARRVLELLTGLKARLMAKAALDQLGYSSSAMPADDDLILFERHLSELVSILHPLLTEQLLADQIEPIRQALALPQVPAAVVDGLIDSPEQAKRLAEFASAIRHTLFAPEFQEKTIRDAESGRSPAKAIEELFARFDSLEHVLRVNYGLAALPERWRQAIEPLVRQSVVGEAGWEILTKASLTARLSARIKTNKSLLLNDGARLQNSFDRYRQLEHQKRDLAQKVIQHCWVSKQKQRLLASTGSRLSSEGAELRRRLTLRGERALRLRQVIALGQNMEGGDTLFDVRPAWMASPETVAQIFPRQALFDVVIIDEASQCRLEDAFPVFLRAKRVVIAGDPKQLPPSRFFESAIAVSEDDDIETDQDLFEKQQGEMEDLLSAALNIEIEEAYLDVHYRSRNSDLIAFSNESFYNSRLQAIPGHPANRTRYAPVTLNKVNGVYKDRSNEIEAEKVCSIVRDLLKRADPPSIGIACFNITQRDLIIEKLDELAAKDADFARSLAVARDRRSKGSFDGLFVKNLENVQGDERDHLIISTTYGPDPNGRFFRRFGPLGRAGGGRRLNVLVTRARDEVHLVTSIPETVYRNLPPLPPGAVAGGVWLLFAYLNYAEALAAAYEEEHVRYELAESRKEVQVHIRNTRFPSLFSQMLANRLKRCQRIGCDVHWGNDGFCVDVALHHPQHSEDVTIGVQCDMNRFSQAADPVEWEIFRNAVLESQGWKIHRLWTPEFFRDDQKVARKIVADVEEFLANEPVKDAIRVTNIGEPGGG